MEDLYSPGFGPTNNSNGSGDSLNKDPVIDGDRNLATNEVVMSSKSADISESKETSNRWTWDRRRVRKKTMDLVGKVVGMISRRWSF